MLLAIQIFIIFLTVYFAMGLAFGIYFISIGAARIDDLLKDSKWSIRLLLFPGVVMSWPFLLYHTFIKKSPSK